MAVTHCRDNCVKKSHPREHWTRKKGAWKPKYPFPDEASATEYLISHHLKSYRAYRCPICGAWHIGFFKKD